MKPYNHVYVLPNGVVRPIPAKVTQEAKARNNYHGSLNDRRTKGAKYLQEWALGKPQHARSKA